MNEKRLERFREKILENGLDGVALVPGSAFGLSGHLRLSYATSMENLQESIKRIGNLYQ